jgi:hypothetical protein
MQLNSSDEAGAISAAQTYYNTNIAGRVSTNTDSISFQLADDRTAIRAVGEATMATTFLAVVGIKELPLYRTSGAKATFLTGLNHGTNLEVSLVLDFTGSMCADGEGPCSSSPKVEGLRAAARELVDIVVNDNQSAHTSRVALVPFSTRIRVAPDNHDGVRMQQLTDLSPTWSGWLRECLRSSGGGGGGESNGSWQCLEEASRYKSNWKILPCVTERIYTNRWDARDTMDYTDASPGPGRWLMAHGGDRSPQYADSTDNNGMSAGYGDTEGNPAAFWNYGPNPYCADAPEENEIVPLTSDKNILRNKIDAFTAAGATAGPLATSFGWYMLSPNWASIWPNDSRPGSYADVSARHTNGAPLLRKIAVIMTDGVYNTMRGNKGLDTRDVADHARAICDGMKAQGIEVYTVGFALDELSGSDQSTARNMLKHCGTSVRHFYETLDVNQLRLAFRDIALRVTPIRLTE